MYHLTREIIKAYPSIQFIYGRGIRFLPTNEGSQEHVCWNEINTLGIPTCFFYCPVGRQDCYFSDGLFNSVTKLEIDNAIARVSPPAIYLPKLGTGCSKLNKLAPFTYNYIIQRLESLCLNKHLRQNLCWPYQLKMPNLGILASVSPSLMVKEQSSIKDGSIVEQEKDSSNV